MTDTHSGKDPQGLPDKEPGAEESLLRGEYHSPEEQTPFLEHTQSINASPETLEHRATVSESDLGAEPDLTAGSELSAESGLNAEQDLSAEPESPNTISTEQQDQLTAADEAHSPLAPAVIPPLPQPKWTKELFRVLNLYLVAVILVNLSLLFIKGHGGDLGYWQDWIKQLSTAGYNNFNGNYPPVYIHWLYVVGKLYLAMGIPLDSDNFLKFLTQIPVLLSHCALTILIFSLLIRFKAERNFFHGLMLLTVFNPAALVNGPMWGQVDLVPATFAAFAIYLSFSARHCYLAIPIFGLSLLTKFQMIAFAPVFGFLFFRAPLKNILGIVLAIGLGALIFLPSILAGHFVQAFRLAYIDTLGQYPMTTFNAANLWILLTGNTSPDGQVLFNIQEGTILTKIFTAKYFGMLLFVIIALLVALQGMYRVIKKTRYSSIQTPLAQALFAAMVCAVAFFTLLPAMHERYLFPAVVMSLAYAAVAQKKLIYPIVISFLSGINMLIILGVNGTDIWQGLSWIMVSVLALCLLETLFGEGLFEKLKSFFRLIYKIPALSFFVLIVSLGLVFYGFYQRSQLLNSVLSDNQIFLTHLTRNYATQDHGSAKLDRSHDGNTLSVGNTRYAQGIGTHANSDIQYQLPADAEEFSFIVGLDDESTSADVQFSVWGDGRLLWQSSIITGNEQPIFNVVDVRGISTLNLKVSAVSSDKSDHADWINTIITTSKKP